MRPALLLLACCLLLRPALPAQTWEPVSPAGGQIHRGITVGSQLLIGTSSGIYRSTDGGATFAPWSRGIPSGNVIDLLQDGNFLFACVANKGIYRSADGGVTWDLKLPGRYLSQNAIGIVRMQKADGHLMVRNSDELNDTLYFSPDFGNTWIKQAISPFSLLTNQVFGFGDVFLTNSLAGVLGPVQGLYRTEDLGQTWTFSGTGITPGLSVNNMVSINDTLYALQKHIFRSTDNGLNWTQVTTDTLKNPNGSFAFSPAFYTVLGRTVYARNGGNASVVCTSWTPGQSRWQPPVAGSPTSGAGLTMFSHAGKMFQTGFNGEIFTASSPTQAWTPATFGGVYSVVVNDLTASGNQVFSTTASRFWAGNDGPNNWQVLNPANIPDNYTLRAVTQVGSNLLMGVSDNFNGPLQMYVSQNQGTSWQSADGTSLRPEARMRTFGDSAVIFGTEGGSLPVAGILNAQGQFVAGLTGVSGFSGTTEWLAMTRHKGELYGLATRLNNPSSRIFRRNSTATNWTVVNQFLFPNGALSFESWQGKLYLGPALGGVLVSADDGANWTGLSSGLGGAVVNHLHAFGDFLAAATDRGIFLLEAGDTTWTDLSGDLPVAGFIKVQSTPAYLWAVAEGGAAWRLRRAGNVSAEPDEALMFSLFPNPARDEARLLLPAGTASWVLLNPQGQTVAQGRLQGGQEVRIPLAHLPAGLYHLRVRSGQQTGSTSLLIPGQP
ncbi:MAG: T9SS type A sorting domain-containing protein [Bacteroidia bacterium]|nr:T9SS type A sorting domain-containing protein [Bacteroidia bacterium]